MERRSPTPGAARKREAICRLKDGLEQEQFALHSGGRAGAGAGGRRPRRKRDPIVTVAA